MMKKIYVLLLFSILVYSCQDEKEISPSGISREIKLGDSLSNDELNALGFKTQKQWLSTDNWVDSSVKQNKAKVAFIEDLHMDDVRRLGWSDHTLRELYQINGNWPDGIFFNGHKTSHGRGDWYAGAQKALIVLHNNGIPWQKTEGRSTGAWVRVGGGVYPNRTSGKITVTDWYEEAIGVKKTHSVTHSVSFGVEASYGVVFPLATVKIGYGFEWQKQSETSNVRTVKKQLAVEVMPRKTVEAHIFRRRISQRVRYKQGFNFAGQVSSNFPRRVNGHFVWFQPASKMLDGRNNVQEGYVEAELYEYTIRTSER